MKIIALMSMPKIMTYTLGGGLQVLFYNFKLKRALEIFLKNPLQAMM